MTWDNIVMTWGGEPRCYPQPVCNHHPASHGKTYTTCKSCCNTYQSLYTNRISQHPLHCAKSERETSFIPRGGLTTTCHWEPCSEEIKGTSLEGVMYQVALSGKDGNNKSSFVLNLFLSRKSSKAERKWKCKLLQSCLFAALWTVAHQAPFCPGKNTGVGCHSLLQGIFLTWGSNLDLPHCRQILNSRSHHLTVRATREAWFYVEEKKKNPQASKFWIPSGCFDNVHLDSCLPLWEVPCFLYRSPAGSHPGVQLADW